jgi:hypothetical protein
LYFLGALLLLGVFLGVNALMSGLIILSFAITKTATLIRGLNIDVCPCSGLSAPLLSVHSMAIDSVLLALVNQLTLYRSGFLSLDSLFSVEKRRNHGSIQGKNDNRSR